MRQKHILLHMLICFRRLFITPSALSGAALFP